jgi:hypothetical protein
MTPIQQTASLVTDLSDVVLDVHRRATRRNPNHLLFVLDRDDPTASELFWRYAPLRTQLARGGCDDVDVIALSMSDGLNLLRHPKHNRGRPTIFHVVADQIEAEQPSDVVGVCIAHGGFLRFQIRRERELN